jgi:hypothetical protein
MQRDEATLLDIVRFAREIVDLTRGMIDIPHLLQQIEPLLPH